jgi:hypothetical protein
MVQVDVRQKRRDDTALRAPERRVRYAPVLEDTRLLLPRKPDAGVGLDLEPTG